MMNKAEVIVDAVHSLSPSAEAAEKKFSGAAPSPPLLTVKLQGGQTAQLDMSRPTGKSWADILDTMRQAKQAAYLKIDPKTGRIADLLIPRPVKVAAIRTAGRNAVEVELVVSQMRHYLRRSNPDFKRLLGILEDALRAEAPVLVTDSRDRREIVDVRPLPEAVAAPGYLSAPLSRLLPPGARRTLPEKKPSRSGKGGAR